MERPFRNPAGTLCAGVPTNILLFPKIHSKNLSAVFCSNECSPISVVVLDAADLAAHARNDRRLAQWGAWLVGYSPCGGARYFRSEGNARCLANGASARVQTDRYAHCSGVRTCRRSRVSLSGPLSGRAAACAAERSAQTCSEAGQHSRACCGLL